MPDLKALLGFEIIKQETYSDTDAQKLLLTYNNCEQALEQFWLGNISASQYLEILAENQVSIDDYFDLTLANLGQVRLIF